MLRLEYKCIWKPDDPSQERMGYDCKSCDGFDNDCRAYASPSAVVDLDSLNERLEDVISSLSYVRK